MKSEMKRLSIALGLCCAAALAAVPQPPAVKKLENLGFLTGAKAPGNTLGQGGVGGTDLGYPAYSEKWGKMFLFFGDTFERPENLKGDWRSNVVGYGDPGRIVRDRILDGFVTNRPGRACAAVEGRHVDGREMTRIPTGAIEVDGRLYLFFFSMRSWKLPRNIRMNGGGAVFSDDAGVTWTEIPALYRKNLLEGDSTGVVCGFTQVFPVCGRDGFVYFFGEGGFRSGPIRLARARATCPDIENPSRWEYFTGTDDGNPCWKEGTEGLHLCHKLEKANLVDDLCGEFSVCWNPYHGRWLMIYTREGEGEGRVTPISIRARVADHPWGPWSESTFLFDRKFPFGYKCNSVYGGLTHERMTENGGKTVYFLYSQYAPVYQTSVMRLEFQ